MDSPVLWWQYEANAGVHEVLYPHVQYVENNQAEIHRMNLFNARLYSGRELMAIDWNTAHKRYRHSPTQLDEDNVISTAVDSMTALIGRNRPKATPVVRDADFKIEQQARLLDKILWAEARYLGLYNKMQRVFNDSLWAQIGALKIDIDAGEVYCERVMPDEIIVDQRECISDNSPMQVHQRKLMSRIELAAKFPKYADKILQRPEKSQNWTDLRKPPNEDYCIVIESWFLGYRASPGRHAIVTEDLTLLDETYTRNRFPFVFLRWKELPTGFYGKPLVEEIIPYQIRDTELNYVIKAAQDFMCVPRIAIEGQTQVVKTQIDNMIARVLHYRGQPPVQLRFGGGVDELYAERERNLSRVFQRLGISEMFSSAKIPDGVRFDSSRALQEQSFRDNERHAPQAQRFEDAYLDAFEQIIELMAILGKNAKNTKRKWRDRTTFEMVDWTQVDLDRDKYILELQASSITTMTPAGRREQVERWMMQGRINPQQANSMEQNPDLEEQQGLMQAATDDIKATALELDMGKFPQPDPLQDLTAGIPYIHTLYLKRARQKGVPQEVLQNYRDWITEAQALLEQDQQMQTMPPANLGPDGQMMPAVATTAQGVPLETMM